MVLEIPVWGAVAAMQAVKLEVSERAGLRGG